MKDEEMMGFSVVLTYYKQPEALAWQLGLYQRFVLDLEIDLVIVDDGSGDGSARATIREAKTPSVLVTVEEDVPWNIPGARNWGMVFAANQTCLRSDIDHRPLESTLEKISNMSVPRGRAYFFTRKNQRGEPLPVHTDSFLINRDDYWAIGGYDENLAGNYGQNARDLLRRGSRQIDFRDSDLEIEVNEAFASVGGSRSTSVNRRLLQKLEKRTNRITKKLSTNVHVERFYPGR